MKINWIVGLLLMASTNMAAMQIKGKVKDSKTGEEIIGAYIVIKEDPSQGTVTGLDGSFNLSVDKPTFTIVCSYMGYKSYEMKISKSMTATIKLYTIFPDIGSS